MVQKKDIKEGQFEKSLEALEKIVKELDEGQLSVEKGLEKFEKGIGLYRSEEHTSELQSQR